jgi:antitoxin YefM
MAITASVARAQLFPLIEQVNEDMKPVLITSKSGNAVLIAESEYESMLETQYLLSTPANREWILKSIAEADSGHTVKMEFPITLDKPRKKKVSIAAKKAKSPR